MDVRAAEDFSLTLQRQKRCVNGVILKVYDSWICWDDVLDSVIFMHWCHSVVPFGGQLVHTHSQIAFGHGTPGGSSSSDGSS